jgi:hypothetical protein
MLCRVLLYSAPILPRPTIRNFFIGSVFSSFEGVRKKFFNQFIAAKILEMVWVFKKKASEMSDALGVQYRKDYFFFPLAAAFSALAAS